MPTLEWIGKEKVINHHQEVPFRVLERQYSFDENGQTAADNGSGNMIIRGDNLEALKALLPRYEGRVKCIYIDPPYNTGNEGWVYNDNVNDPKIKKWLGEVVGKEGEDLTRHDKWLCMMYPRLKLLQKLLAEDGILAISIGYQELSNLLLLCNEVFSTKQIMPITVQTSGGKPNGCFNVTHEYIVIIAPIGFEANPLESSKNEYNSPFHGMNLATFNQTHRPNQTYPIYVNERGIICGVGKTLQERVDSGIYTGELSEFVFDYEEAPVGLSAVWPVTSKGDPCVWRLIPQRLLSDWEKGYIKVVPLKSQNTKNKYAIQYLSGGIIEKIEKGEFEIRKSDDEDIPTIDVLEFKTAGAKVPTIMTSKLYYTARGGEDIRTVFGEKSAFPYPKPEKLIEDVIHYFTVSDDIILDSFAGSGTTAHAVLNMNKADGGNRKFILVEMMDYAETVTAERVRRVIDGYKCDRETVLYDKKITTNDLANGEIILAEAKSVAAGAMDRFSSVKKPKIEDGHLKVVAISKGADKVEGTGGSFSFYDLGEPLLIGENLNESVGAEKIREYVWFTETKLPYKPAANEEPYYLGTNKNAAYYFYYEPQRITVLDHQFLSGIHQRGETTVIYADRCAISSEKLAELGILFKKIPRDISRL